MNKPSILPAWDKKQAYCLDEDRGLLFFTFEFADDAEGKKYLEKFNSTRNVFHHAITNSVGRSKQFGHVYPLQMLSRNWTKINAFLEDHGTAVPELSKRMSELIAERSRQIEKEISQGHLEFDDLEDYFVEGFELVTFVDGEKLGGIVTGTQIAHGFFSSTLNVYFKSVTNFSTKPMATKMCVSIREYSGLKDLSSLPVRKVTEEEKLALSERGRAYHHILSKGSHYMAYRGHISRDHWLGSTNYRADGRVMIDAKTMSHIENNAWENAKRFSPANDRYRDDEDDETTSEVTEAQLWTAYPFVFGFSFSAKMWGRFSVTNLSSIQWKTEAFDRLVLPDEEKTMIRALVSHQTESFSDIIDGKGGGTIFLLHGAPGQGKTLTAEATAEALRRPLYAISVGELGTAPDQLEERLREILDVADTWNAVMLLDEADIFLEARDEKDIVRNAMVGVFLRLLEYHQGVLFLTSNRAKNIDKAFLSRISVVLHYPEATSEKRAQIWDNLLRAAKIEGVDVGELKDHNINGRQIKNVIRLAQTLATSSNTTPTERLISKIITRMIGSIDDLEK